MCYGGTSVAATLNLGIGYSEPGNRLLWTWESATLNLGIGCLRSCPVGVKPWLLQCVHWSWNPCLGFLQRGFISVCESSVRMYLNFSDSVKTRWLLNGTGSQMCTNQLECSDMLQTLIRECSTLRVNRDFAYSRDRAHIESTCCACCSRSTYTLSHGTRLERMHKRGDWGA
jgi:hypothetical protein